jgi:G3E family GTPase
MLMGSELGSAWRPGEKRESKMVFIGKNMPKESIMSGLSQCIDKKASAK